MKIRNIQDAMLCGGQIAFKEYFFTDELQTRFDYAVPVIRCANGKGFHIFPLSTPLISFSSVIELDGGTGAQVKKIGNDYYVRLSGHNSPKGLRDWREKNNAAMAAGWRVFHYAPEEVIKAGRKTKDDEPLLKKLPWL